MRFGFYQRKHAPNSHAVPVSVCSLCCNRVALSSFGWGGTTRASYSRPHGVKKRFKMTWVGPLYFHSFWSQNLDTYLLTICVLCDPASSVICNPPWSSHTLADYMSPYDLFCQREPVVNVSDVEHWGRPMSAEESGTCVFLQNDSNKCLTFLDT